MKKSSRVVSTLLLGATVASASTGVFAVESKEIIKEKLAGESRFETAVEVSNKFGEVDTVVLVNYTGIADALAATPLAKMKNAPILLTESGSLTKATADQIEKLKANNVIIIGGTAAVSENVEKELKELGKTVERVAGEDRYATSEAVAKEMGKDGKVEKVAVVNGIKGLADALSVAAPAAKEGMAIVLSDGNNVVAGEKIVNEAKTKYVIGGDGVVSKELTEKLGAERLAGANRNATNAEVLNKFYDAKELDKVYVAKDGAAKENQLVDALAAGPLAGKEGNPLVLAGSELDKAQEAYLKDRIAKSLVEVGDGINQNTVSAIVKALTVKEETPSDKAEVTGVNVLNANQLEVKFSQKVDKDSAEDIVNYTEIKTDADSIDLLTEARKEAAGNDDKNVRGGKAEVQADGKTVLVTFDQQYDLPRFNNQETLKVKIENIMNEDKSQTFEKYENKNIKLLDNTLPELKGIKQVGPKHFDLVFSEPVTAKSNSEILSAIRINNGAYNFNAETRVENADLDANVIRIKTSSELKDGEYDFTIKENKIMDYAGLKVEAVDTKLNVKKDETDLTASVYKVSNDTVTLDFNKEIEKDNVVYELDSKNENHISGNENLKYYLDYAKNDSFVAKKAEMKDGKVEISFDKPIPTGDHKIVVVYDNENDDKIVDLWDNELSSKEISFNVAKDTIAPTATVSYDKKDKNVIEVKYSEEVEGADKEAAYELKDSKGNYVTINRIEQKKENKLVYRLFLNKDLDGQYTLKIKENKIFDTSVEKNELKEVTFDLATLDQTPADVTSVRWGGKDLDKIYVEFSEAMRTSGEGNILDKKLYDIEYTPDGEAKTTKNLDDIEDAKIELNNNSSVIITLPEKNEARDAKVKVGRVCDANGNFAGVNGTKTAESKSDAVVEKLTGDMLDEKDILDKGFSANVIEDNKIEVFVRGNMIAADASKIALEKGAKDAEGNLIDVKCSEVGREIISLTGDDDKDITVTKLTLKFDDDTFKTNGELASTESNKMNFKLTEAGALTTTLETESEKGKTLDVISDDKAAADYLDKSAVIFKDDENIAKKIEFKLTEKVKSITKDTFEVDGFKVEDAKIDETDSTKIILTVKERQFTDDKADVKVKQVKDIYDMKDNKTTGLNFTIKEVDDSLVSDAKKLSDAKNAFNAEVANYKKDAYTEESWTEFNAVVVSEKEKVDAEDATVDSIEGATKAVKEAAKKLVTKEAAEKEQAVKDVATELEKVKASYEVPKLDTGDYTAQTKAEAVKTLIEAEIDKTKVDVSVAKNPEDESYVVTITSKTVDTVKDTKNVTVTVGV